jgi:hypothetical protein
VPDQSIRDAVHDDMEYKTMEAQDFKFSRNRPLYSGYDWGGILEYVYRIRWTRTLEVASSTPSLLPPHTPLYTMRGKTIQ